MEKIAGDRGIIDLLRPGVPIVERKSLRRDLIRARQQAVDDLHGLADAELPRVRVVSDFRTLELTDLETGETTAFLLRDPPKHIHRFQFVLGRQTVRFRDQGPVNITAAEQVGRLPDALERSGHSGHRLEVFLTRIVFCLFADDTGSFEPKDMMRDWPERLTPGATGPALARRFDTLNTPEDARQSSLSPDLAALPRINGRLIAAHFPPPAFDEAMRTALLNACRFDRTPISPAIFGALFQSEMDRQERRAKGAHCTTEKNILERIGRCSSTTCAPNSPPSSPAGPVGPARWRISTTGSRGRSPSTRPAAAATSSSSPAANCGGWRSRCRAPASTAPRRT